MSNMDTMSDDEFIDSIRMSHTHANDRASLGTVSAVASAAPVASAGTGTSRGTRAASTRAASTRAASTRSTAKRASTASTVSTVAASTVGYVDQARDLLAAYPEKVTEEEMTYLLAEHGMYRAGGHDDLISSYIIVCGIEEYVQTYTGSFEFMRSLSASVSNWGMGLWSPARWKGAANCLRAEAMRTAWAQVVSEPVTKTVANAIYTAVFDGTRVTVKITKHWEAGKTEQVCKFLSGSDNDSDYTGFAFLRGSTLQMWSRFKDNTRLARAMEVILGDPDASGEAYAIESNRCFRCNRTLTVPSSIHRGLGPECASLYAQGK